MTRQQIGLFGGTFDPPHLGHLILASEAAQQFHLERVLWALAPDPPHKLDQPITPLSQRLEMLKLAVAGNPVFEISYLEINRPGPHYTVDTVRALAAQTPDADLTLLIGGDSFHNFTQWRDPAAIVAQVRRVGVMLRPGAPYGMAELYAQIPGLEEKVEFLDALLQEISSSELRKRIAQGHSYRYYLPCTVYEYVEENRLYRK